MKIRKLLRILHRDFGYFIVGMTVVYALSGIYLNHRHDFNPDYKIFVEDFKSEYQNKNNLTEIEVKEIIQALDHKVEYKKHYLNNQGIVKVFISNGEIAIDPKTGEGTMHYLRKRPVIFEMNKLHTATLGTVWKWVSDLMAVILLFVAVSGVFILKGKRGLNRWGWWLTIAGIIIPLAFVLIFL
ncbi:MAG: hypothetical protein GQ525_00730 [Draconibacterium sp.]|nr:hypothetical protein [Draconibacterium sp.]